VILMAETKIVESTNTVQAETHTPRYRVTPRYGMWFDDGKWILEIALPGVAKDHVKIKTLRDYFQLRAERDTILYALDLDFNFEIEQEKTKAEYKEGLLRVEFYPYKPLDHAFVVPIV